MESAEERQEDEQPIEQTHFTSTGEKPGEMIDRIAKEIAAGAEPPCRLSMDIIFREDGGQTVIHEAYYPTRCHQCGARVGECLEPLTLAECEVCQNG